MAHSILDSIPANPDISDFAIPRAERARETPERARRGATPGENMSKEPRVGIIGLGFMGSTHFHIYRRLGKAKIVAVADVDPNKRKGDWRKIAGNIGDFDNSKPIDFNGVRAYECGCELIADPNVEVVDICTPTPTHKDLVVAALKAGKHVISEKPIVRDSSEMAELLRAVKSAKTFYTTGMCLRTWPEYRHAFETFKAGKIGKLVYAHFRRISPNIDGGAWKNWFMQDKLSGGALLDLHLHDVDLVRYFFGRPKAVTAVGVKGFRSDKGYDHVVGLFDFGDGTVVSTEGGWTPAKGIPFEMSFQIVGTKGTIRLSETGYSIVYENGKVEKPKPAQPGLETGWHVELDYFIRCVQSGRKPDRYLQVKELDDSLRMVEAERVSMESGKKAKIAYKG
jgi:predicted dehydrogenase